ncbi:MAG: iron-containing alcohol dehydrogenase [Peptococcaceae bacterium]|nr:iron-containing alcohol dehydrogenase [Peptococcaceae bacterium]
MSQVRTFAAWPNRIVIGQGSAQQLPDEIRLLKGTKAFFITDEFLRRTDLVAGLVQKVEEAGIAVQVFSEISPNPLDVEVEKAAAAINDFHPDVLVAVGGGSPIDAAKAANVVATHGGVAKDYWVLAGGSAKITGPLLPLIAIPTTSGTGSEVSSGSLVTDSKLHIKMSINVWRLVPAVSIIDPLMTVSMPPKLTAFTGMDALTHAIEAYVSNVFFVPSRGLALEAIRVISRSLRKAVYDGNNLQAREDMAVGSMTAGLGFVHTLLGLVHGMAHQLSTICNFPHGLANGMVLPVVMKYNMEIDPQPYADIAAAMGVNVHGLTPREAALRGIEEVIGLSKDVGLPQRLSEAGVKEEDIQPMVERALKDSITNFNPRRSTAEDVERLYRSIF